MADILIIEDDGQMRRLLARILTAARHEVREVENGRAGIAEFKKRQPELIISDIVMPDMEGIETIRTLREAAPDLPIIAISGDSSALYLRAAKGLGASATLEKPFEPRLLVSLVDKLIGG